MCAWARVLREICAGPGASPRDVCASEGGLAQTCAPVGMFFPDLCASGDIPCRFVGVCRDFFRSAAHRGIFAAGLRACTGICQTRSPPGGYPLQACGRAQVSCQTRSPRNESTTASMGFLWQCVAGQIPTSSKMLGRSVDRPFLPSKLKARTRLFIRKHYPQGGSTF